MQAARQTLVSRFSRLIVLDYVVAFVYLVLVFVFAPQILAQPAMIVGIVIAWLMRAVGWHGVVKRKGVAIILFIIYATGAAVVNLLTILCLVYFAFIAILANVICEEQCSSTEKVEFGVATALVLGLVFGGVPFLLNILEIVTAIKANHYKDTPTTVDLEGQIQGKAVEIPQNDESIQQQHQVYFMPIVAPTMMQQQYPPLPQQQQQFAVVGNLNNDGSVPQWVPLQQ